MNYSLHQSRLVGLMYLKIHQNKWAVVLRTSFFVHIKRKRVGYGHVWNIVFLNLEKNVLEKPQKWINYQRYHLLFLIIRKCIKLFFINSGKRIFLYNLYINVTVEEDSYYLILWTNTMLIYYLLFLISDFF